MEANKFVLAMYDIRSKQDFIYRSTHIKEIVGGSLIIRDCFKDYLYPAAEHISPVKKGIFHDAETDFTPEGFEKHLEEGYIGELIYDGGGNFLVVYKNDEVYRKVNYEFSKRVLEKIGTLQILPTRIVGVDFDDYEGDRRKLYEQHRIDEGKQSFIYPWGTLPIVQIDYATSKPLVGKIKKDGESKFSRETYAKREKYYKAEKEGELELNEKELDKMVEERGKESLLAVIYADGNNMGAEVQKATKGCRSYADCVKRLREFSSEIQKNYIDDRCTDIDNHLSELDPDREKRRFIILSGDEITFICKASHAYDIMKTYLEGLPEDKNCSACAGAAIFHSHAPYSEAYRIAEECCESGKSFMKEHNISGNACFMDFHYCQGAIGVSLEDIRREEVGDLNSKPWQITGNHAEGSTAIKDVEQCRSILNKLGRSNVKGLAEAAKRGSVELIMELKRIKAHHKKDEPDKKLSKEEWDFIMTNNRRSLVYDMVIFFDLWFDNNRFNKKADQEGGLR